MSETKTNQIILTAEQLVNIVGHAATQEQLDNVRRELDSKIDRVGGELNAKIDRVGGELNDKIDRVGGELNDKIDRVGGELNAKIDRVGGELSAKIDRVDDKINKVLYLILGMGFTALVSAVTLTAFIMKRLPPQ